MFNPFRKNTHHFGQETDHAANAKRPVKWVLEKDNVWRIVYADETA